MLRAQLCAGSQHLLSRANVLADGAHVVAGRNLRHHSDLARHRAVLRARPVRVGLLDRDDGVGAGRQGSAGHDAGSLPGAQPPLRRRSGRDVHHDLQLYRRVGACAKQVRGAQGKAVHAGVGEGGQVDRGDQVFSQHTSQTFIQWRKLDRKWLQVAQNVLQSLVDREHFRFLVAAANYTMRPGGKWCATRRDLLCWRLLFVLL